MKINRYSYIREMRIKIKLAVLFNRMFKEIVNYSKAYKLLIGDGGELKLKTMIMILLATVLISCEQTVDSPNLPYEENLVISAVLRPDMKIREVLITRTLPPLDNYDREKAIVRDAQAIIRANGVEYPLNFDGSAFYYSDDLVPEAGKEYKLEVQWKDKNASSATMVPEIAVIESFKVDYFKFVYEDEWYKFEEKYFIVKAIIKPSHSYVYSGVTYSEDIYISHGTTVSSIKDTAQDGMLYIPVLQYSFEGRAGQDSLSALEYIKTLSSTVNVYDKAYYNYYLTQWDGEGGDNIFGTSGLNVKGNIKNGIGLFVGMNESSRRIEFD